MGSHTKEKRTRFPDKLIFYVRLSEQVQEP